MSDQTQEVLDELTKDLKELGPLISAARGIVNHSPSQVFQINAGGLAVWILALVCSVVVAVTLTAVVFVAIGMSDLNRQTQELRQTNETQQAYINAAFAQPEKQE